MERVRKTFRHSYSIQSMLQCRCSSQAPDSLLLLCLLCCLSVRVLPALPVDTHRGHAIYGHNTNTHTPALSFTHRPTLYLIPILSWRSSRARSPRHPYRSLFSILTSWSYRTFLSLENIKYVLFCINRDTKITNIKKQLILTDISYVVFFPSILI